MNNPHRTSLRFEYQYDDGYPKTTVELSPEATLSEVLEGFEAFLRAAGYCFEGHIDIVEGE